MTDERACLTVTGPDAHGLLQNLVTCDLDGFAATELRFGALLTPQGKLMFDFFISKIEDGFRIETLGPARDGLLTRLTLYKLRAAVTIAPSDERVVIGGEGMADPRCSLLPCRSYGKAAEQMDETYHTQRVERGVPEAGHDFAYGDVFPHDVLMDRFEGAGSGVAFGKGCFVGQEVVSRMKHRGTARRRPVILSTTAPTSVGDIVLADEREIGAVGTVAGSKALAIIRVDRAVSANELKVADQIATFELPPFSGLSQADFA